MGITAGNPQIHADEGFGHMFRKVEVVGAALVVSFPLRHILLEVCFHLDLSQGSVAVCIQNHLSLIRNRERRDERRMDPDPGSERWILDGAIFTR